MIWGAGGWVRTYRIFGQQLPAETRIRLAEYLRTKAAFRGVNNYPAEWVLHHGGHYILASDVEVVPDEEELPPDSTPALSSP
jgi:hypothetical protein